MFSVFAGPLLFGRRIVALEPQSVACSSFKRRVHVEETATKDLVIWVDGVCVARVDRDGLKMEPHVRSTLRGLPSVVIDAVSEVVSRLRGELVVLSRDDLVKAETTPIVVSGKPVEAPVKRAPRAKLKAVESGEGVAKPARAKRSKSKVADSVPSGGRMVSVDLAKFVESL